MSSTYLTSDNMTTIERLLAEVRETGPERSLEIETAQARLLVHAFEGGMAIESDLRSLLAEHVKLRRVIDRSHQRWTSEANAPSHRQEHMLPSPEEEFNIARSIHPMAVAPYSGNAVIGRNAVGETAMVHWLPSDATVERHGHWARLDTGEPFDAVHWVETTWTAKEVLDPASAGSVK
ncbi:hypothetical protein SAZ10_32605 [Mesorhizobium sp. BAC0120]|uniref:hypothetical protein n=1 Tax=Mesorhizobium sp. BAC0120 TaxID=3090670 RepID=UPI00298BD343|nr:hypothetical protein [Mesorhizobium sp. BAC0120]MDW6026512.1 hypothetical protein [Mesorhizobium sp. BAC0120]